jgi:hypothetical protein
MFRFVFGRGVEPLGVFSVLKRLAWKSRDFRLQECIRSCEGAMVGFVQ